MRHRNAKYTEEQVRESVERVRSGMTFAAAGKCIGALRRTVQTWCNAAGVTSPRARATPAKRYQASQIRLALYVSATRGVRAAVTELGIPEQTVREWKRRYGRAA